MIGLTGIVSYDDKMGFHERERAVLRMMENNGVDFDSICLSFGNITLGVTRRANGNNKDLAIKPLEDGLIGFSGYGKFCGEKKLSWADTMADRIFKAFQAKGMGVLKELEGSFLCVLYYQDEFFVVSDRMGSKSCYSYNDDGLFLFSPSVSQAMKSGLVNRKRNMDAVVQVLASGFFLDDCTLVEGITRFPAATVLNGMACNHVPLKKIKYWVMPKYQGTIDVLDSGLVDTFQMKTQQAIDELHELEPQSVVPLSGGLDSRTIACYVAGKQALKTITYDFGDETKIASDVCKALKGETKFFSKTNIQSPQFHRDLTELIRNQTFHSVANQYFYASLFRKYFLSHPERAAIYDGVYMDILFSAPYTYEEFGFDRFLKTYGSSMQLVQNLSGSLKKVDIVSMVQSVYQQNTQGFENCDGVSKSQLSYVMGRLRRYVSESYTSRENYCYVLKPGYNYDLMDFGFDLSLKLRKGVLYTSMLNREFPDVMKIPYKDSYGNRMKTVWEKVRDRYMMMRLKLSYASQGLFRYYPYQADYYFFHERGMDDFKDLFIGPSYIPEIFDEKTLLHLFKKTKQKQYLLNMFGRVLFVQQFYKRNGF